jgi:hypothetical protein
VLPGEYAVCRLPPDSPVPDMAHGDGLVSMTRTDEELSVVCRSSIAPATARVEQPWRCLCVVGPLDLSMVGVLSALAEVLAQAGIAIFVVSTYDTDYLLVRTVDLRQAVQALQAAGHPVRS